MRTLSKLTLLKRSKLHQLLSILLLMTMVGNMLLLPGAAQAQPQAVPPAVASVIAGGERFMDAAPQALGRALQLAQRLDYISQVELADLSETTLIQARQDALATAEQAATAQGAVGAIANGLDELNYQVQAAANMGTEVSNLESSGFDAELETALADMGLTSGQISELEDEAAANFTVRGSLPTETVTLLQDAGLSQTEIDQVEQTLADYGLADNTLSDRLAQFRASQQELSVVRTEALVAYLQLLTKQVFVRQLAGETGRELTSDEVDEVVKDQLRLLIHLGYLDNLWGSNPDPNVGEGQWLFIERYSLRVAERLDALILDTQNVGLIVDLLVALQIHSTALAALAGDAQYAKNEVDPLADFLATMLGDNLPGSQGYRHVAPPFWWGSALALGVYNPALATSYEPSLEPAAVTVAETQVRARIKGLAYPLWFQTGGDPDPSNNQATMFFQTAPPLLPPGVLAILNQVMGGSTPLEFIWEVLTGNSENWWAIGGNVVLSFVPIGGEILDLISLFTDPTLWGKAMSLIGLVASLLSDGAEVITAIGAVIPPTLAATVPGSALLEALDVGAAILKNVRRLVSSATYEVIKRIPFDKALQLGVDTLGHLAKRAWKEVNGVWPGSLSEVFNLIQSVLNGVWNPFVALLTRYSDKLDDLFTLGFGEGGFLAGRVLSLSDEAASYSDEVIEGIVKIGDELAAAGIELSDEAVEGLGKLVHDIGGDKVRRLLTALPCSPITQIPGGRPAGLASPLRQTIDECQELALKFFKDLPADNLARKGFSQFVEAIDVNGAVKIFQSQYDDVARTNILETIANSRTVSNKNEAAQLVGFYGDDALELFARYTDDGYEALSRFRQQAVDLLRKYGDDPVRGNYLGPYLKNIRSAEAFELTKVNLTQGFEMSTYAQIYKIDIHIAGNSSDTLAEAAVKAQAFAEMTSLKASYVEQYALGTLPAEKRTLVDQAFAQAIEAGEKNVTKAGVIEVLAQTEVAAGYRNLDWYQVKVSSGKSEVDVFIPYSQWQKFTLDQRKTLKELIAQPFDATKYVEIDFYQELPLNWKFTISKLNPQTTRPAGSIKFASDSIIHHDILLE